MRIIITENQRYVLRRLNKMVEAMEDVIGVYENLDNWCTYISSPDNLVYTVINESMDLFVEGEWDFFHDRSESGGSDMDLYGVMEKIIEENYGNYLRNLHVRKCGSRF